MSILRSGSHLKFKDHIIQEKAFIALKIIAYRVSSHHVQKFLPTICKLSKTKLLINIQFKWVTYLMNEKSNLDLENTPSPTLLHQFIFRVSL